MGSQGTAFLLGLSVGIAVVAIALIARAQTSRKGRTASLSEADRRVERAELGSMIAHELKNPLMSIKGLATTATRLYPSMSDEERLEFFELIDAEASRMKLVTDETSTALKIDAGALVYDIRPEDFGKVVENAAWGAPIGGHAIVVEAEEDLTVPVDLIRVAEIVAHLVDNAVKFSPPDSPIEVRAYRGESGEAVLEVADRGPGIAADKRDAVFARYARWRPPGYEETPGAGLGLFICRAHARAHGGRIDVVDEPERGTMLRVVLPGGIEGG